jgi:3-hydroxyisobutyrate dehydrogenase-like beta-hydroxyacid dehydrogenase
LKNIAGFSVTKKTGFIGLGAMGHPMAQNILKAGIPLVIHDIDAGKTKILSESGAIVASSPMEVAKMADRIVCLVETTDQANDVICGPEGIIHGARNGSIVICMSTIDPLVAKRIGADLDKKNIRMLDAPVSGGTGRANEATLSVIVGGEKQVFNECQDIFDAVGNNVFHIGELGKGLIMKLINNMLGITNTITLIEGLTIGVKSGIGLETMLSVLKTSSGASAAVDLRVPRIIEDNFEPGGTMDIVYKDQELVTAYAKQIGVPTLMANVSQQVYQMARTAGLNKKDSSAVVKIYENLADVNIVGRK